MDLQEAHVGTQVGLRVQMADTAARPAIERWAVTGRAEGVSAEFALADPSGRAAQA